MLAELNWNYTILSYQQIPLLAIQPLNPHKEGIFS